MITARHIKERFETLEARVTQIEQIAGVTKAPEQYSLKETQEALEISRATVYRLIDSGDLHPQKVGGKLMFQAKEVNSIIK